MQIKFCCPYWGFEEDKADAFVDKVMASGYNGVEVFLPASGNFTNRMLERVQHLKTEDPGFAFIALQLTAPEKESVDSYIQKMEKNLWELAALQPDFINSHTGKDFYSFDENCKVIEAAMNIGSKTGVRILHETHRGRFSFHAASLLPYLKKFPALELVGDFSHFCTVSESMLQDQEAILEQIIPHVSHIHARVGSEQGPQVNDPAAPEWEDHLNTFINWWQQVINNKRSIGTTSFTITPEFGPAPYMPAMPFTKQPLSDQWNNNCFMMNTLKKVLT